MRPISSINEEFGDSDTSIGATDAIEAGATIFKLKSCCASYYVVPKDQAAAVARNSTEKLFIATRKPVDQNDCIHVLDGQQYLLLETSAIPAHIKDTLGSAVLDPAFYDLSPLEANHLVELEFESNLGSAIVFRHPFTEDDEGTARLTKSHSGNFKIKSLRSLSRASSIGDFLAETDPDTPKVQDLSRRNLRRSHFVCPCQIIECKTNMHEDLKEYFLDRESSKLLEMSDDPVDMEIINHLVEFTKSCGFPNLKNPSEATLAEWISSPLPSYKVDDIIQGLMDWRLNFSE